VAGVTKSDLRSVIDLLHDLASETSSEIFPRSVIGRLADLLDAENISDLEPSIWPEGAINASSYKIYYSETGRAGGAGAADRGGRTFGPAGPRGARGSGPAGGSGFAGSDSRRGGGTSQDRRPGRPAAGGSERRSNQERGGQRRGFGPRVPGRPSKKR